MWLGGASEKAAAGTVIAGAVAGCEASFLARGLLSSGADDGLDC